MKVSFACGRMVRLVLFHKNLHVVQIFVKKKGIFRPDGRENAFWVNNRVSPEYNRQCNRTRINQTRYTNDC